MQIYPPLYYKEFRPNNEFENWATIEVKDFGGIPNGIESFILKGGLYAVFDYKGSSSDNSIFQYIFSEWLPNSTYLIDHRFSQGLIMEKGSGISSRSCASMLSEVCLSCRGNEKVLDDAGVLMHIVQLVIGCNPDT
jgi:hypothetical protein